VEVAIIWKFLTVARKTWWQISY